MDTAFNKSNYLFILANQGAGGHRLGRIISCLDNVHWYSNNKNGINPWDTFFTDKVTGKNISQYHYDRTVDDQAIPLLGERIEKWWAQEDIDYFYNNVWAKEIEKFYNLTEKKYIHWILHDSPQYLLERFPNAKIIALIDSDIDTVVHRHLQTTSRFPCYYQHKNLKPDYLNDHAKAVNAVNEIKNNATERDLWVFKNYLTASDYDFDYEEYLHQTISEENINRKHFEDPRYIKITWETFNISQVIEFLKSNSVDSNYIDLLS